LKSAKECNNDNGRGTHALHPYVLHMTGTTV
jgi:hypothetical protein